MKRSNFVVGILAGGVAAATPLKVLANNQPAALPSLAEISNYVIKPWRFMVRSRYQMRFNDGQVLNIHFGAEQGFNAMAFMRDYPDCYEIEARDEYYYPSRNEHRLMHGTQTRDLYHANVKRVGGDLSRLSAGHYLGTLT